jgi:hypothetical protein
MRTAVLAEPQKLQDLRIHVLEAVQLFADGGRIAGLDGGRGLVIYVFIRSAKTG